MNDPDRINRIARAEEHYLRLSMESAFTFREYEKTIPQMDLIWDVQETIEKINTMKRKLPRNRRARRRLSKEYRTAVCKGLLKLIGWVHNRYFLTRAIHRGTMKQQARACEQREKARRCRDYYRFFLCPVDSDITPAPKLDLF
jgi:hypothetical protein